MPHIHRALISVSDKRGIVEFASALHVMGVEIISTGGTYAAFQAAGVPARQVSEVTGFPEILDGRVKTLHPHIHGALLARSDEPRHMEQLGQHGIAPIDMVVVNLYPFRETVARSGVSLEEAVEQIDIGGPAMLRSAAKNYLHKVVIVNPERYASVLEEMRMGGGEVGKMTCAALAREVFHHTASYDAAIAAYLDSTAEGAAEELPAMFQIAARKELNLRYGENPHQRAALYGAFGERFQKLHGKELSYNNIVDISAAAALIGEFDDPAVAIIKHTNPCGAATAATLAEAYEKAFVTDTASAFGGIVAVNRPLDMTAAERINAIFTEVIVAPAFEAGVLEFLKKKKDRRLLRMTGEHPWTLGLSVRSVPGGFLVQDADETRTADESFRVVTRRTPSAEEERALRFAWRVTKHVKSNAIVYTTADRTLGVGAGQMSRVDSSRIAVRKATDAGLSLTGSVVGSDAFFPFADGLLEAVRAGATAVVQPGGSVRDQEVVDAANENNIAMVFTGVRHFRH